MSRRFSLAYLTIPGTHPVEQIKIAAKAGYDFVSLRPIPMHLPNEPLFQFDVDKNLYNEIKEALEENNIKLLDIELARIREDLKIEDYESAFEAAAELGATDVISSIWTPNKDFYFEQFAKLCDLAWNYNLYVNLEFVTWASVKDLKDAKEVIKNVKRRNAGYLIDTLHFYRSKINLQELDNIPKERFRMAHICDGPKEIPVNEKELIYTGRDARLYVGEGSINIKEIINRLSKNIILSIELPHIQRVKDYGYAEHARRCLKSSRKYFANNYDRG